MSIKFAYYNLYNEILRWIMALTFSVSSFQLYQEGQRRKVNFGSLISYSKHNSWAVHSYFGFETVSIHTL